MENGGKSLAIIGGGGHGKVIADVAEQLGWNNIVFFDSGWPNVSSNGHWKIVGNDSDFFYKNEQYHGVIVAIGNNEVRYEKTKELIEMGVNVVSLIHPSAVVSKHSHLGPGSLVAANAVINPYTNIGFAAIVNTSSSIDHDCEIGDSVHICPGARIAGGVKIKNKSWIGIGASVIQKIEIGESSMIGAGSAVINNISDHVTAVGIPAKVKS